MQLLPELGPNQSVEGHLFPPQRSLDSLRLLLLGSGHPDGWPPLFLES